MQKTSNITLLFDFETVMEISIQINKYLVVANYFVMVVFNQMSWLLKCKFPLFPMVNTDHGIRKTLLHFTHSECPWCICQLIPINLSFNYLSRGTRHVHFWLQSECLISHLFVYIHQWRLVSGGWP